jgi:hydrogenase maturation factor
MIYHIAIHIVSLDISIFLGLVSIFAFVKNSNKRMLFMALGFVTLAIVEGIMLLSSTGNLNNVVLPAVNIELPHIVLLVMITLFGLGILKAR